MNRQTKPKPEVGQTLYSLNVGNSARHRAQELTPVTVTKVGRKYFTCVKEGWNHGTQYHIDSWYEKTEYSSNTVLYQHAFQWEDEKECVELARKIEEAFSYRGTARNLPVGELRKIAEIIDKA